MLPTKFAGYQINNISTLTIQDFFNFMLMHGSKEVTSQSVETIKISYRRCIFCYNFLYIIRFECKSWKLTMVTKFPLNTDFFCMWHLNIKHFLLLYKIGKWFLMMVLRLGSKCLYCVMKFQEVKKAI